MGLGKNIKKERKASGLRQTDLAKQLGVSHNYVAQIESGRKTPPIKLVAKIADILDTRISKLLAGDKIVEKIREELRAEIEQEFLSTLQKTNK